MIRIPHHLSAFAVLFLAVVAFVSPAYGSAQEDVAVTDDPCAGREDEKVGSCVVPPQTISQERLNEIGDELFEEEYRKKMISVSLLQLPPQVGCAALSVFLAWFTSAFDKYSSHLEAMGEVFTMTYAIFGTASIFISTSFANNLHNRSFSYTTRWWNLFFGALLGGAVSMATSYAIYYTTESPAAFIAVGASTIAILPIAGLTIAAHVSKERGLGIRLKETEDEKTATSIHLAPVVSGAEGTPRTTGAMVFLSIYR